ncbi:CocE/NonD family hydrolase [Shewanella dokdonensis]|uniref:CocE/NonD family hydrolase n=1 Tax=Shewanella dokdonensis TaxID=712036 RepID=A0ABX8DCE0_9GAMM|nr:CocE/NonD family hydrolase [Shewanella dokdonensis]MCL1074568.1 CocE/NonD family hydrolase [Shewanella dokdonensis]QVK22413.1 CocE/NonD family hydrolase [Shewanella dokdonensis]
MRLHPLMLALAASTVFPVAFAADKVTPMTPDGVASYEKIRPQADFIKRVEMVPMRDGTKLYTVILMKKGTKNAPILLSRTPYDAKGAFERSGSQSMHEVVDVMDVEFVEDNYIRVYQDIRGLHNSEGDYVTNRPLVGPLNNTGIDESTDAYDTIDWLVKHVPEANGNVGIVGSSYLGFTALMAEINPHPALKAAVPQSPMVDGWIGDDWFHNGAFRNVNIGYSVEQGTAKAESSGIAVGAGDDYSRFLEAGSTGDYLKKWGFEHYPFIQKMVQNPAYSDFWSLQAVDKIMAQQPLKVPTMLVVGQWDQEDSYGAPAVYKVMEPKDKHNDKVSLVIGPWRHSGVNHYGYNLGALTFTGDTAREFRVKYMKPFFDHYLKGAPDPKTPPVLTYATGENHWNVSPKWPMGTPKKLYMTANMGLSFSASADTKAHDDYVSDPAKPVPFIPRPINMEDPFQWKPWLVQDQRFASSRPDVLVYSSDVLDKPVHIMGAPMVNLFAATSGTDADWVVKLVDVYPNSTTEGAAQGAVGPEMTGFELPIGIEIFRGRYVHGFDKPAALTPGKVEHYRFGLPNVDHVFLPGHKIMVQVQSTLFPLYDRNPQTFVDNIFYAKPADYQKATMSVFHSSNLELPIAN